MDNSTATCRSAAFTFFVNYITNLMVEPQPQGIHILGTYDFIIIGGGAAGCVLANRLSEEKDWKVLLIEPGPEEPEVASIPAITSLLQGHQELTWSYNAELNPRLCDGQNCTIVRGKMFGGSTSLGGMSYTRGSGRCYDRWRDMGNIGWSYKDVLPYFKKFENNRDIDAEEHPVDYGVGGELSLQMPGGNEEFLGIMKKVLEKEGYDYINDKGATEKGYGFSHLTQYNGERMSAYRAFVEPVRKKRTNLHICTSSVVTKILINPKTKKALGVQCLVRNSTKRIIYARKEVILSAGAIVSPQLLQISGVGPSEVLSKLKVPKIKILKGVGSNFHDHVASSYGLRLVRKNPENTTVTWPLMKNHMDLYNNSKSGPLVGYSNAFVYDHSSKTDKDLTDIAVFFNIFDKDNCATLGFSGIFTKFDVILVVASVRITESRGKVTAHSRDVFQKPKVEQGLLTDETDFKKFVKANLLAYKLARSRIFKKLGFTLDRTPVEKCSHLKHGTKAYFECVADGGGRSTAHLVGTCKMGPTWDADAVVDHRLKVHGVRNLRVIDASIIPQLMDKHTMGSTMMIAEKGADMIKQDWLCEEEK